jgi:hypothetical protein
VRRLAVGLESTLLLVTQNLYGNLISLAGVKGFNEYACRFQERIAATIIVYPCQSPYKYRSREICIRAVEDFALQYCNNHYAPWLCSDSVGEARANLWGFFTPPVAGADLRAALVASCLRGALPPVDLRAVCLVRAIASLCVFRWICFWNCEFLKSKSGMAKVSNGTIRQLPCKAVPAVYHCSSTNANKL